MENATINAVKGLGRLFYIASPNETSFEHVEDVPNYTLEASPHFWFLIALEYLVLLATGKTKRIRINDSITSITGGIMMEMTRILSRGVEFKVYLYIYEYYRVYELPWNSAYTWITAALLVDLAYYCIHRMCHEVNIMWAAHQMHHSSECYNLTTALRQSVFQFVFAWPFYLPMAFFVPPSVHVVHLHLNLIYQFWIHSGSVTKLGPLEYILNTPSHHRVHHGCNRYCIDKNYAGFLIIWDRMFGTFEPENEDIAYGLTHAVNSFNPLWLQVHHLVHIWNQFWTIEGFTNKMKTLFYGPGWLPGKPRLGLTEELPDHKPPMEQYNPIIPAWCSYYCLVHFIVIILVYLEVAQAKIVFDWHPLSVMVFIIFSVSCLGGLLDNAEWSTALESVRCFSLLILQEYLFPSLILKALFFVSSLFWGLYYFQSVSVENSEHKKLK